MDADAMVRAVVASLNAWADAELDKVRAEHAELSALILPRLPAVLPTPRQDTEVQRRHAALMREDERLALQRAGGRRESAGSQLPRRGRGP